MIKDKATIVDIHGEPLIESHIDLPLEIYSTDCHYFEKYSFTHDSLEWGFNDAFSVLSNHVECKNLINIHWVKHQYGMILCKLAAYVRSYPSLLDTYWAKHCVLGCLITKYKKEFDDGKRSALRLILEKDDIASRFMVLYVSRIAITECNRISI